MLEWLSKLIPKELNVNFSPSLTINNIKINSDNHTTEAVRVEKDQLIINDATKEGKQLADKVIKQLPHHLKHNDLVIEDTNLEHYQAIDKRLSSTQYKEQLKRFKGIVPKGDVTILEVAIIVKEKYDEGENVSQIKGQAVQRFGPRAGMICNLYSSGYFDSLILPLYEEVSAGELALDEYLAIYEMIVTESPLAMFVGVGTTREKAKEQLLAKITANKSASVDYLNIHGIGKANAQLINDLLQDDDVKAQMVEDPTVALTGGSVKATIYI